MTLAAFFLLIVTFSFILSVVELVLKIGPFRPPPDDWLVSKENCDEAG